MIKVEKKFTPNLPPHAKRVFKGVIFEVWQWEQKMFDGSTEIFECLRRRDGAQVVVVVKDKILIQSQKQPHTKQFLSLPGGRCEWDEDPLAAAKRERLEETGYVSDDWLLWRKDNPSGTMIYTAYTYVARDCRKIQAPRLDAGEKIKNKLISFNEFIKLSDNQSFRVNKEIVIELFRARMDKKTRDNLKKIFYAR